MRTYLMTYDNFRDYCQMEFSSDHRAGSKANLQDAKNELVSKLGRNAKYYEIIKVDKC